MAGLAHPSSLTSPVAPPASERFAITDATPGDDEAIRHMLRSEPLGGTIRLSLCREPNTAIADAVDGEQTRTLVARDRDTGNIVGVGRRAVRTLWVNGEPRRVGYLAGIRRDRRLAGHVRLLVEGFAKLEAGRQPDESPYDLTSIVADNTPARRLFERGPRGVPIYEPICEWSTLIIPVPRRTNAGGDFAMASSDDMPRIADHLQRTVRHRQFAPAWTEAELCSNVRCRGLTTSDFLVHRRGGAIAGCAAVWDQSSFKQAVVHSYAPSLSRWRPLINAYHAVRGLAPLPPAGQSLGMAFLSHVALESATPDAHVALVRAALAGASGRGIRWLIAGFASRDPSTAILTRVFEAHEYHSVIYAVRPAWSAPVLPSLNESPFGLEVAIL